MKNPWISYTLLRLLLFFGVFLALALLDFNPFFAAIIAAAVSFALSLVFLDRQRKAMSESVAINWHEILPAVTTMLRVTWRIRSSTQILKLTSPTPSPTKTPNPRPAKLASFRAVISSLAPLPSRAIRVAGNTNSRFKKPMMVAG